MAEEKVETIEKEEEGQEVEVKLESPSKMDGNTTDNSSTETEVVVSEEKKESEEELDDYSKRVQKRIKTLTEKYRTEERNKDEALRFAETVKNENDQLKHRLNNLDTGYLNEYGGVRESLDEVMRKYTEMVLGGDENMAKEFINILFIFLIAFILKSKKLKQKTKKIVKKSVVKEK